MCGLHLPRRVLVSLPGGFPNRNTVKGEFVPVNCSTFVDCHFLLPPFGYSFINVLYQFAEREHIIRTLRLGWCSPDNSGAVLRANDSHSLRIALAVLVNFQQFTVLNLLKHHAHKLRREPVLYQPSCDG